MALLRRGNVGGNSKVSMPVPRAALEAAGQPKPEYEQIAQAGPVIFWSAKAAAYSRTRWSKIISTPVYGSITVRNAAPTKKLLELMG